MDSSKYDRSVRLLCSTCGSTQFEYDDELDGGPIRCTGCDRVFTRDELIQENGATIDANLEELSEELAADMQTELENTLRKAFAGSKHIKFR